jgi:NitT/TauT family transport system permease protein
MITIGLCGLGIDAGMSRLNAWLLRWQRGVEG